MKAILEFDLNDPHDKLAHKRATSSTDAYIALHEIANTIFRPARKYGYDPLVQSILDSCGEIGGDSRGAILVAQLEKMFYTILEDHDVNLDDLE